MKRQIKNKQLTNTDKQLFTDSFDVCWRLLKRNNYYLNGRENDKISTLSLDFGHDMYDAMMIIMNKIIKSNDDKVTLDKMKNKPVEIVILNDTSYTDNDDECVDYDNDPLLDDGLNQKQQVGKVTSQIEINQNNKIISNKRKTADEVGTINSKKKSKPNDNKECTNSVEKGQTNLLENYEEVVNNNTHIDIADSTENNENILFKEININNVNEMIIVDCKSTDTNDKNITEDFDDISTKDKDIYCTHDDSIIDKNKQIKPFSIALFNDNYIDKLQNNESIENEEVNIDIKDEILSDINDSFYVDKINDSDNSIKLPIQSTQTLKCVDRSCSSKVIKKVNKKMMRRIATGSRTRKKKSNINRNIKNYDDDDDDNDDKIKITEDLTFDVRSRIVKLATENPTWSLAQLRKHTGCKKLLGRSQIVLWQKQIELGGSLREKHKLINNWVYKNCIECHKKNEIITNDKIVKWGLEAKKIFKLEKFAASLHWLNSFKVNHEITGNSCNLKINPNWRNDELLERLRIHVPDKVKVKVVKLANENPNWSLKKLRQESGCDYLKNIAQLENWKHVVKNCLFTK